LDVDVPGDLSLGFPYASHELFTAAMASIEYVNLKATIFSRDAGLATSSSTEIYWRI